jgi:hypothetical protein
MVGIYGSSKVCGLNVVKEHKGRLVSGGVDCDRYGVGVRL